MLTKVDRKKLLIVCLVLGLSFAAFSPALRNGFFLLDDSIHLLDNEAVRGLDARHLRAMFTCRIQKIYVPLTYLSYALEYALVRYKPFLYHLDNILLHLGVTALVFVIAGRIGLPLMAAGIGALLFGIHPLHVESVAWITERKDVLYAFFYLLSVYFYLVHLDRKTGWRFFALSALLGLLSVLAKPMALSLPLVLLLFDLVKGRSFSWRIFVEKIPFGILLAPVVWVTYAMHARVPGQGVFRGILIWTWTFSFYLRKFFVPTALHPSYVLPEPVALTNGAFASGLVIFILFWAALVVWRKNRYVVLAGLYYVFSIFFLLRFDEVWDGNIVADRFMYLPCLGLCLLVGWGIDRGLRRIRDIRPSWFEPAVVVLLAAALVLMFQTFNQTRLWKNTKDIWDHAIRHEPRAFIAYNSRGCYFEKTGRYKAALTDYSKAIALHPAYAQAFVNRGIVFYAVGQLERALKDFNEALSLKPSMAEGYTNRGAVYNEMGQPDKALRDFNQSLRLAPYSPYTYSNRGKLYFEKKEYAKALADYTRAIELSPKQYKAFVGRGNVYLMTGQLDLAKRDFDRAVRLNPRNANAYYNRSIQRYMQKDFRGALADVRKARALGAAVEEKYEKDILGKIQDGVMKGGAAE